jgi:probable rRNA maturation factor
VNPAGEPPIELAIDQRQTLPFDVARFARRLRELIAQQTDGPVHLSLALVDDAEIRRINREFLEHDYPTDVISFRYSEPDDAVLDGELILGVETAARVAAELGWSLDDELLLYGLHGYLHLCGYDDQTAEARQAMRQRERELLAPEGITPRGLEP